MAGTRVPLRFVQTVPVMQGQVAGQTVALLFDSGAKLSYLERSLTTGFPDAGTVNDFMPMFGAFTAATVRAPMVVSGRAFTLRFGAAPRSCAGADDDRKLRHCGCRVAAVVCGRLRPAPFGAGARVSGGSTCLTTLEGQVCACAQGVFRARWPRDRSRRSGRR